MCVCVCVCVCGGGGGGGERGGGREREREWPICESILYSREINFDRVDSLESVSFIKAVGAKSCTSSQYETEIYLSYQVLLTLSCRPVFQFQCIKHWVVFKTRVCTSCVYPVSILYKSVAGRYRPVSYPDGPITVRYRFIKNASWGTSSVKGFIYRM